MLCLFNSTTTNLAALFVLIASIIIVYYKLLFKYWQKRNISLHSEPTVILGNAPNPLFIQEHVAEIIRTAYRNAKKKGFKHAGGFSFNSPKYFPIDLEYVKNILLRDYAYFTERGFYYNERDDPLSANLFALGGDKWKTLRSKLSPAFTSGKLKFMFDELYHCAVQMQESLAKTFETGEVNISEVADCFTVDVIGSCAFGLECNSFKHPEAEFRAQGRKIFYFTKLRAFKTVFAFSFPNLARKLGIRLFDRESTHFFVNVVKNTLEYRKKNIIVRRDFMHLLLDMIEDNKSDKKFTTEELTAQVFVFFAAGFETSSLTLAFCLYELALNPDMQERLRDEIKEVLNKFGKITYEAVLEMKYLNQVIEETLRKYPPVPFITRVCIKDYHVPNTTAIVEKDIEAIVSILGIHHDPEYYPNPEVFDPERFNEENKYRRHQFAYIPFGEGPRMCIGLRFGVMQAKVGVISLLQNFKLTMNKKTQVPIEIEPYSFTLIPKKMIYLNLENI